MKKHDPEITSREIWTEDGCGNRTYPRGETLHSVLQPKFKCAGAACPGLPYRASEIAHPASCVNPLLSNKRDRDSQMWNRWISQPDTIINGKRNGE